MSEPAAHAAAIACAENLAAPRSLVELTADKLGDAAGAEPYVGLEQPPYTENRSIKAVPGTGWFVYFRIYGPDVPAFDCPWQLPDMEPGCDQLKASRVRVLDLRSAGVGVLRRTVGGERGARTGDQLFDRISEVDRVDVVVAALDTDSMRRQ